MKIYTDNVDKVKSDLRSQDLKRLDPYLTYILVPKTAFALPGDRLPGDRLRLNAETRWHDVHDGSAVLVSEE